MSNVHSPESPTLRSSPALPHLHTCIETVIREAVQSGRDERPVRQFLRLHANHFDEVLDALHAVYDLPLSKEATEASPEDLNQNSQPSILPAAGIITKKPSQWKDGFDWSKVLEYDDDDDDDLAEDEDEKEAGKEKKMMVVAFRGPPRRPYESLPHAGKKRVLAATDRLSQAVGQDPPSPITPASEGGAALDQSPDSDNGSDTPRQTVFKPSYRLEHSPPAPGAPALQPEVDQTVVATDPEQSELEHRLKRSRDWVDSQTSQGTASEDPNLAQDQSGNGSEDVRLSTEYSRRRQEKKLAFYAEVRKQMEEVRVLHGGD